jgi:hypothetical protein
MSRQRVVLTEDALRRSRAHPSLKRTPMKTGKYDQFEAITSTFYPAGIRFLARGVQVGSKLLMLAHNPRGVPARLIPSLSFSKSARCKAAEPRESRSRKKLEPPDLERRRLPSRALLSSR